MQLAFPAHLAYPILASLAFPVTLYWAGAWWPSLRGNNARRFLAAAVLHTVVIALAGLALPVQARPAGSGEWAMAVMVWITFLLLYLEIWALLSRGYTLAMLLVLLEDGAAVAAQEIARRYRGGAGLDWIMQHRAGGMRAAGLISIDNEGRVGLTSLGVLVARLYSVTRRLLCLRATG